MKDFWGFPIDNAPQDGTFVRVHRVGRNRPWPLWEGPLIAQWREDPGIKGWFTRAGEYCSPFPDSWAPIETDRMH